MHWGNTHNSIVPGITHGHLFLHPPDPPPALLPIHNGQTNGTASVAMTTTSDTTATRMTMTRASSDEIDRHTSLIQIPSYGDDDDDDDKDFYETRRGVRDAVKSIRISHRKFDVTNLPPDLLRVYHKLVEWHDEDYALIFVFIVRTASELHRAWHLSLLTSKILQRIKQKFKINSTWTIGVTKLIFRVDDGSLELHRKVPYDYDSEFQDLYMRLSEAFVEGHISIHEALIYQSEIKKGVHTAPSGLFFRNFPGRLLVYPLVAATCAVIFFEGDWVDAGVAAICGLSAGSFEWGLTAVSEYFGSTEVKVLIDVVAGGITGIIGGLFFRYVDYPFCISAIFLGNLYWYFYGTAFVIGFLEVIAGELQTGVTRFVAVMVKSFVLSLCSAIGFMVVIEIAVYEAWVIGTSSEACGTIDLNTVWWRVPLYLACSASVLGQYRFPVKDSWRALAVMLAGYEVQYQVKRYLNPIHQKDFLDTAAANISGAMAAVVAASIVRWGVDSIGDAYIAKLLKSDAPNSFLVNFLYRLKVCYLKITHYLGLGRRSDIAQLDLKKNLEEKRNELNDPRHPRQEITLSRRSEQALIEAVVESQGINLWAILMPAVYQLVPGSLLAKFWYNIIFPPPPTISEQVIPGTNITVTDTYSSSPEEIEANYGLWVVSLSLAMGLILGSTLVSLFSTFVHAICGRHKYTGLSSSERASKRRKDRFQQQGVMESDADGELDPNDVGEDDDGGKTDKKTDEVIETQKGDSRVTLPAVHEGNEEEKKEEPSGRAAKMLSSDIASNV